MNLDHAFPRTRLTKACRAAIVGTTALALVSVTFAQSAAPLDLTLPPAALHEEADAAQPQVPAEDGAPQGVAKKSGSMVPWVVAGVGGLVVLGVAGGGGGGFDAPKPGKASGLKGAASGSGGAGVLVGVVDTGADITHARIRNNVAATYNALNGSTNITDTHGHGTASASVVTLVAPHARLLLASGLGGTANHVDKAVNWAVGARAAVVSLSLGATGPTMHSSIRKATAQGTLVVAAAGNDNTGVSHWPAKFAGESWAHNRIIVVGALDESGNKAWFSNWDHSIAQHVVFAPGVNVSAARVGGGDVPYSGTSAATPVVAGQAALIKGTWQFLPAEEVARIIFQSADRLCSDGASRSVCASRVGPDPIYGWGAVNIEASMRPAGKLQVKTPHGSVVDYSHSRLSTGAPSTLAALGSLSTVAVDDFNRGFDVSLPVASSVASGVLPVAGPTETQVSGVKFRMGLTAANGAFSQRGGTSVEFGGAGHRMAFGMGTGGAQDGFFGLAGTGAAPLSLSQEQSRFNAPYFALAQNATHMGMAFKLSSQTTLRAGTISQGLARNLEATMAGLTSQDAVDTSRHVLALELQNKSPVSGRVTVVTLGQVLDRHGYMGASGQGALAIDGAADTSFLTLAVSQPLAGGTSVSAMAALGSTGAFQNKAASLLEGASSARSRAWSLGLSQDDAFVQGDRLSLTAHMPLRVRSGSVTVATATSQNAHDGSLNFERRSVSLAPTGRERQLTLAYAVNLGQSGELAVQANYRQQPNHDVKAGADKGLGVRYSVSF